MYTNKTIDLFPVWAAILAARVGKAVQNKSVSMEIRRQIYL